MLQKGVKNLKIWMRGGEPCTLSSSIFAYGQQLEHLKLGFCVCKPLSIFNGFSNLGTLELVGVCISSNSLSSLISNCPLVKRFYFWNLISYHCLDIVAPNLEYLNI